MDSSTRWVRVRSGDCTPHTEKRIRRRLSSRRCNMKQACLVLCYWWLQRIGLLVTVARRHPTAIMFQYMRVNATFKRRRAASFFDVCSQNRKRLFSLHRQCVRSIGAGIEAFFPIPIPNRYRWYRPIPSTRCQYRSHPMNMTESPHNTW